MGNTTFFSKWSVIFVGRLMKDFNLDLLSGCAIIGNAGHESNGFKSLQEIKPLIPGSKGGYGIMQWTGPRRREYEAYCKRNKLDPADMESNYKFLFIELKGPEGKVLPLLRKTPGLEEKTKVFMKTFLRPGIEHLDSRVVWAKRAYEAYQDANVIPPVEEPKEKPKPAPVPPVAEPEPIKPKTLIEIIIDWIIDALSRKN